MESHFLKDVPVRHVLRLFAIRTGTAVVLIVVVIAALCQPSVARPPGWTITASPNASGGITLLNGVACVRTSFCMGVGYHQSGQGFDEFQTLSEMWNGSDWVLIPTPNPGSDIYSVLQGITCLTGNDCVAVGEYGAISNHTLIESWNGRRWSIVPSPNVEIHSGGFRPWSQLSGVSCVSANDCTAVGYAYYGNNGNLNAVLVETWNGRTWSITKAPSTSKNDQGLFADSCVSADFCIAVGGVAAGTLIDTWNGTRWSIVPPDLNPGSSDHGELDGVSCTSPTACVAVGSAVSCPPPSDMCNPSQNLVESWDGVTWSIVPSPDQGTTGNALSGVSCSTPANCIAVGASVDQYGFPADPLIESWNGSVWSLASVSVPAGATNASFSGMSCTGPSACVAVGQTFNSLDGFADTALIETWNGASWNAEASPASTLADNFLQGISCTGPTDCVAVGGFFNGNDDHHVGPEDSLIETLSGGGWSTVVSPNEPDTDNYLQGVSCTSGGFCMAVGISYFGDSFGQTLAEVWNGTNWSVIPTPSPDLVDQLAGVSCTGPTFCMAIGTVIEEWNGSTWSVVPNPMAPATGGLTSVSCASDDMCVGVGATSNGGQTLAETWNGSSWIVVPSPVASNGESYFNSVSCDSVTYCVAVGFIANGQGPPEPLAASWNGLTWTLLPEPRFGAGGAELSGVSCPEATNCNVVGIRRSTRGGFSTVAVTLSGTVWNLSAIPSEPGGNSILEGVSCTTSVSCAAVGAFQNHQGQEQTLIEGKSPAPSIVATAGSSQSIDVHKAFTVELQATVLDGSGNPIPGAIVTFEAPSHGPSGRFSGKDRVITNAAGVVTAPTFTANGTAGSYEVKAVVSGISGSAVFKLTNLPPGARTTLTTVVQGRQMSGADVRDSQIQTPFSLPFPNVGLFPIVPVMNREYFSCPKCLHRRMSLSRLVRMASRLWAPLSPS
jgi:hypothetical protein